MKLILIATGDFSDFTDPSIINTLNLARVGKNKFEVIVFGKFKKKYFDKKLFNEFFRIEEDIKLYLFPYFSRYISLFISYVIFPLIISLLFIRNFKSDFYIISRNIFTTNQLINLKKFIFRRIKIFHDWHLTSTKKNLIKFEKKIISSVLVKSVFISLNLKKNIYKKYNINRNVNSDLAPDGSLTFKEAYYQLNEKDKDIINSGIVFSRNKTRFSFCYIGSDQIGKGVDIIINAANKLPQYDFYLFGKIDKENYSVKYENVFFKGSFSNKLLICGIRKYDAFLLPNKAKQIVNNEDIGSFTSPLKLFDYMTTSKPIISSKLKNLLEVLPLEGYIGFEENNLASFIEALNKAKICINQKQYDLSEYHARNYTWGKRLERILRS